METFYPLPNFVLQTLLIKNVKPMINLQSALVETVDALVSERLKKYDAEFDERVRKAVEGVAHPSPLMSRAEVAEYLHCSLVTIHAMMKDGRLPFTKLGASTKFSRTDVEKLAKSSRRVGL